MLVFNSQKSIPENGHARISQSPSFPLGTTVVLPVYVCDWGLKPAFRASGQSPALTAGSGQGLTSLVSILYHLVHAWIP